MEATGLFVFLLAADRGTKRNQMVDLMPLYQGLLAVGLGVAVVLRFESIRRRRDRRQKLLKALELMVTPATDWNVEHPVES